jgi:hypothetical protein
LTNFIANFKGTGWRHNCGVHERGFAPAPAVDAFMVATYGRHDMLEVALGSDTR